MPSNGLVPFFVVIVIFLFSPKQCALYPEGRSFFNTNFCNLALENRNPLAHVWYNFPP